MMEDNAIVVYCDMCRKKETSNNLHIKRIVAFREYDDFNGTCPRCGNQNCKILHLTQSEISPIYVHAECAGQDEEYLINKVFEFDELKRNNPEEFDKLWQPLEEFRIKELERRKNSRSKNDSNSPKCPTCGSTNVKKISGGKRWLGVGLFGLASSNIGKTYECKNCQYKW